jgi:hypothetical protein
MFSELLARKETGFDEICWVVRHGVKMSGMPAGGYPISDAEMWGIVAFVKSMPARLSIEEYASRVAKAVARSKCVSKWNKRRDRRSTRAMF